MNAGDFALNVLLVASLAVPGLEILSAGADYPYGVDRESSGLLVSPIIARTFPWPSSPVPASARNRRLLIVGCNCNGSYKNRVSARDSLLSRRFESCRARQPSHAIARE